MILAVVLKYIYVAQLLLCQEALTFDEPRLLLFGSACDTSCKAG